MAAMLPPHYLFLALGLLFSLSQLHSAFAAVFKVGDYSGKWGTENYFQAGDLLSFDHHTKSGAVHQVSRDDYKACETVKPIRTYGDLDNVAHLKEESTYYFISGDKSQCEEGRKLMVVVLAGAPGAAGPATAPVVSVPPPPPPSAPPVAVAPAPSAPAPSVTPVSPPAPTVAPSTPPASSPAPTAPPTSAPSPSTTTPSSAPSPSATTPSSTPSPSATTPSSAASPSTTTPSPSTTTPGLTGPLSPPAPGPANSASGPFSYLPASKRRIATAVGLCSILMFL